MRGLGSAGGGGRLGRGRSAAAGARLALGVGPAFSRAACGPLQQVFGDLGHESLRPQPITAVPRCRRPCGPARSGSP